MNRVFRSFLLVSCLALLRVTQGFASQVVFSEVMYNPVASKPEYIEVWNITATPLDMARWVFTEGINFTFPDFDPANDQAHFLKQFERILISSADDAATRAAYPTIPAGVRIFGPWTGSLDNGGERITLKDKNAVVMCTLKYGDQGKWPVAADGTGHSLVLADENRVVDDWHVWRASTNNGGSPGVADPALPAAGLVLNEVHFSPTTGHVDWVELYNLSGVTQSASGLFLATSPPFTSKVTLAGSVGALGVLSFDVDIAADNNGDVRLYLIDATNQVRDAVILRRKIGRDSWQRFPTGGREWYNEVADTRDAQNNPARNTAIVVNEIMVDPPSNERDGEFIELYNRSAAPVNIGGWKLNDAVDFTFPTGTTIPAGGYLVIGANAQWLNSTYSGVTALGNWSGSLANGGDRIRLEDADGNLVNQVEYRIGGEWPELAGGGGSSLELINPDADNSVGSAWMASDESAKSTFQTLTINGGTYLRLNRGGVTDDELQLWLVGDGHVILHNVVLRPTAGTGNLLVNSEVSTLNNNNVEGWQARGTHWATYHDAEGVHIVADGGGDNKCNHAEKDATGMLANTAYTLTFQARWVYGKPRVVVQSWDESWGGTALVGIPSNLGTPGAPNSRYNATVPPQITGLNHAPAVPATGSTVKVTARVSSNTPLTDVQLWHRLDNINYNGAWNTTAMVDDGTAGDTVAGDGVYTASVPLSSFNYNSNGSVVEYYVKANAANGQSAYLPRGSVNTEPLASSPPKTGLWVVDVANTATDLRKVRTVISNYWLNALLNEPVPPTTSPLGQGTPTGGGGSAKFNYKFPRFSSHYFPCVYIHNDSEIYYGAGVHKTGSPFTRQTDNALSRGKINLPGDHKFRGKSNIYWDNDSGTSMLHNRIHRYWLYLFGVPGNENEVCRICRNNGGYTARETSEVFDKEMLDRIWDHGSDGLFYEIDDKFNIGDDGHTRLSNIDGSWDYGPPSSPGPDNAVSYHNNFVPKSRETEYDYGSLIEWCRQLETNSALTQPQIERMGDIQAMAAYAAVRGYSADWDNITMSRGKNGFFYNRSTDHRWMLIHWDSDNAFQSSHINDAVVGSLTNVGTFYARPFVRRYVNYYFTQMLGAYAANGPRIQAWTKAEEAASPSYSVPTAYRDWPTTTGTSGQTRIAVIQAFLGGTVAFATSSPAANAEVQAESLTVTGTAPFTSHSVICVGQPWAVLTWPASTTWNLTGVRLRGGANALTFRMLDREGIQVGTDIVLTITKTNNALPVVSISSDPASQNVGLGDVLQVDASSSYDPEGTALTYTWSVAPASGFAVSAPNATSRNLVFTVPGSYDITVQATDADGQTASATRTCSVFSAADFDPFNGRFLNTYAVTNVEPLDNYSPSAWYSFQETSGSLVVQLTDAAMLPLRSSSATYPLITRSLPASSDFVLQTNLQLEGRQFGNFVTGLHLATMEDGVATRYAFGLDNGNAFKVYRSSGGGSFAQQASIAYLSGDITLRISRSGANLLFQYRSNGTWTTLYTLSTFGTSTTIAGGVFASSGAVNGASSSPGQSLRVAFDYLLVSDPGNSSDLAGSLRITEIMYHPVGAGVEFVELRNMGSSPINLNGVYFEDGTPFSLRFTFTDRVLQPGQFCVVTENLAGFAALYGNTSMVAGEYVGSLNNGGERIVLKDGNGNVIHDFSYATVAPWPLTPDGHGPSLEVISTDPVLYGVGTNWRASKELGGSPGYLGLAVDSDGDGDSDTVELAFGSDPNNPASRPAASTTERNATTGHVTIRWPSQAGRAYAVEYCDNLVSGNWQVLGTVTATGAVSTYTDTTAGGSGQRFYRIATKFP